MQQYMLHCLQQKHRLKIQLLLLIVPILSRENATRVYRSSRLLRFSASSLFFSAWTKFSLSEKELSSSESDSSLCDAILDS